MVMGLTGSHDHFTLSENGMQANRGHSEVKLVGHYGRKRQERNCSNVANACTDFRRVRPRTVSVVHLAASQVFLIVYSEQTSPAGLSGRPPRHYHRGTHCVTFSRAAHRCLNARGDMIGSWQAGELELVSTITQCLHKQNLKKPIRKSPR